MSLVCGPILGFRGQQGDEWRVSVVIADDGETPPGPLTWAGAGQGEGTPVEPALVGAIGGLRFYAYEFQIAFRDRAATIDYGLAGDGRRWSFVVPGTADNPRIAYASCNGFSTPGSWRSVQDKNALWHELVEGHRRQPYHLLLMGGDQIYADQLWAAVPALRRFNEMPRDERLALVPDRAVRAQVERFYTSTYRDRFSQPGVADALASIPSVMMWDDHDIFDGWGSYDPDVQASVVFRMVFEVARACFSVLQLQMNWESPSWPVLAGQDGFGSIRRFGNIGLLILDLRSQRTQKQVMAPGTWDVLFAALDREAGLRHLIVMSSIPVMHPGMAFLEQALDIVPGRQELEDDLHDQWISRSHKAERLRLIHRLLDFADAKGTRVTILSGDVHVAAVGAIESTRRPVRWLHSNVINQLTSSAIVHPPPPGIVRYFLERMATQTEEIDRGIQGHMLQFPATNYRIIGNRNWLSLEWDDADRIWANWHVEGEDEVVTKVVQPCEMLSVSSDAGGVIPTISSARRATPITR